jgi:hypothetical protein
MALMNEGGQRNPHTNNQQREDEILEANQLKAPIYNRDIVLQTENFAIFKNSGKLDSLRVKADKSFRKSGSPFVMILDLSYLKIPIYKYSSSDKYGILLIKESIGNSQISMIQFYEDFSYELRQFNGKYLDEIGGFSAFTSQLEEGLDYYMAPEFTTPSNRNIALHFSIRKMYPMIKIKKNTPPEPTSSSSSPTSSSSSSSPTPSSESDYHYEIERNRDEDTKNPPLTTIQGKVTVGGSEIQIDVTKIDGPNETTFTKKKNIDVKSTEDMY